MKSNKSVSVSSNADNGHKIVQRPGKHKDRNLSERTRNLCEKPLNKVTLLQTQMGDQVNLNFRRNHSAFSNIRTSKVCHPKNYKIQSRNRNLLLSQNIENSRSKTDQKQRFLNSRVNLYWPCIAAPMPPSGVDCFRYSSPSSMNTVLRHVSKSCEGDIKFIKSSKKTWLTMVLHVYFSQTMAPSIQTEKSKTFVLKAIPKGNIMFPRLLSKDVKPGIQSISFWNNLQINDRPKTAKSPVCFEQRTLLPACVTSLGTKFKRILSKTTEAQKLKLPVLRFLAF